MPDTSPIVRVNKTKRLVLGKGPRDAKIMIVGEAPGKDEERLGEPFVGRAGELLTEMLGKAGIVRSECYITNVVKERPERNNIKPFVDLNRKVPPTSDDYNRYVLDLVQEINDVDPNVIVAVGGVALWALCGLKGIQKWRGSIIESSLCPGRKVIPLIHPAAALRQYIHRYYIQLDLKKVRQHSGFPEIPEDPREYILAPSMKEACGYLDECMERGLTGDYIGFDIEVASREVSCISFAHQGGTVISIPFVNQSKDYFTPDQEVLIWKKIAALLEDERIEKVAQNASFDVTFLYRRYGIRTRNLHDTMIAQAILYPEFDKGLGFITSVYTTMPYYKDEGKEGIAKAGQTLKTLGSQEAFWLYNAKDSIVLVEALPRMLEELKKQGNYPIYLAQKTLIEPFLYMTERGVRMDTDGLLRESRDAEAKLKELNAAVRDLVGYDLNTRSPKQLLNFFYTERRHKPYLKGGKPTTDETALKRLSSSKDEVVAYVARLVLQIRSLEKRNGTYFKVGLDEDNRLRGSVNIVGTKFGRISIRKTIFGTGANMQNQPPIMRKYMLPDEGYVAYEVDLSQAENRVVALLSGDANMLDAFASGRDIHKQTAGLIFGVPYSEVSNEAGSAAIAGGRYSQRDWGKKANHGLNYGMRKRKAGLLWEVPESEAGLVVDKYHKAYPGVRQWHRRIEAQMRKNRTLVNLFGRKCTFYDRWSNSLLMEAYSFVPQSTVADKLNRHGVIPFYFDQDTFHACELLMQVHDSMLFQIPISAGWEYHATVLSKLRESLEEPLEHQGRQMIIPMDAAIIGRNFYDAKRKDAPSLDLDAYDLPEQLERAYLQLTADAS